jgi:4-amino-4-deoxy-L-arabinose transferase-like glycosyltransferase
VTDTIRPEGRSETSDEARRQVDRRLALALGLGFAMVVGLVIRLVGIGLPPLAFHGARQLYDALMARGFWVDLGGGVPAGARAAVSAAQSPVIEPPLVQGGAALSFLTVGGEHLWPVRAASALLWVGVAPAVWGLVRRLSGTAGATAAMLVWLFLPFGVALSRSFQPDGPMLCFVVLALWSMVRFDDEPGSRGQASVIVSRCS